MATSTDDPGSACLTVLPQPMVIVLSCTTVAGIMSTSIVLMLLGLIAYNFFRNVTNPPPDGEWRLIRTHIDAYLLSLFCSEIVQGLGAALNVKWVLEGVTYCSDYCSVQGALQAIGDTGVAMNTLAIAIHTFIVIFFWWKPGKRSVWIYRIVITSIWGYITLFVIIGFFRYRAYNSNTDPNVFFSPSPYWCWISGGKTERLLGEYFWLWSAAIASAFLYTIIFFRVRGNIQVDQDNWRRIHFRLRPDQQTQLTDVTREARAVIWYPICYLITIAPITLWRWVTEKHMNYGFTGFAITVFSLSGVFNVVLFMLIRRNLLLLGPDRGGLPSSAQPPRPGILRGSPLNTQMYTESTT